MRTTPKAFYILRKVGAYSVVRENGGFPPPQGLEKKGGKGIKKWEMAEKEGIIGKLEI